MTDSLCTAYAHLVALLWSGLGWDMIAHSSVVACASGSAEIAPGCLALRAVRLVCWAGCAAAILLRMPGLFPLAVVVAFGMSLLRCFVLVGLMFRFPTLFGAVHGQCGYAVFMASVAVLAVAVLLKKQQENVCAHL